LAEILVKIAKELNVGLDKVLNKIKSRPRLKELRWKEEQIRNLEMEQDEFQSRENWIDGELAASK